MAAQRCFVYRTCAWSLPFCLPIFQACLCSLLLFLSYVIHMKYRPFLARQFVAALLRVCGGPPTPLHRLRCTRYLAGSFLAASAERPSVANPAFTRLSAPSKSPPIKNPSLTRGHKSPRLRRRRGPRKSVVLAAKRVGQSMGATVVFDYNHLETLFLVRSWVSVVGGPLRDADEFALSSARLQVCSLLVLLAGLLFVSGGFQEESAVSYALSVFVVVLVGGSTLVLVGVIAFEMVRAVRYGRVLMLSRPACRCNPHVSLDGRFVLGSPKYTTVLSSSRWKCTLRRSQALRCLVSRSTRRRCKTSPRLTWRGKITARSTAATGVAEPRLHSRWR